MWAHILVSGNCGAVNGAVAEHAHCRREPIGCGQGCGKVVRLRPQSDARVAFYMAHRHAPSLPRDKRLKLFAVSRLVTSGRGQTSQRVD